MHQTLLTSNACLVHIVRHGTAQWAFQTLLSGGSPAQPAIGSYYDIEGEHRRVDGTHRPNATNATAPRYALRRGLPSSHTSVGLPPSQVAAVATGQACPGPLAPSDTLVLRPSRSEPRSPLLLLATSRTTSRIRKDLTDWRLARPWPHSLSVQSADFIFPHSRRMTGPRPFDLLPSHCCMPGLPSMSVSPKWRPFNRV